MANRRDQPLADTIVAASIWVTSDNDDALAVCKVVRAHMDGHSGWSRPVQVKTWTDLVMSGANRFLYDVKDRIEPAVAVCAHAIRTGTPAGQLRGVNREILAAAELLAARGVDWSDQLAHNGVPAVVEFDWTALPQRRQPSSAVFKAIISACRLSDLWAKGERDERLLLGPIEDTAAGMPGGFALLHIAEAGKLQSPSGQIAHLTTAAKILATTTNPVSPEVVWDALDRAGFGDRIASEFAYQDQYHVADFRVAAQEGPLAVATVVEHTANMVWHYVTLQRYGGGGEPRVFTVEHRAMPSASRAVPQTADNPPVATQPVLAEEVSKGPGEDLADLFAGLVHSDFAIGLVDRVCRDGADVERAEIVKWLPTAAARDVLGDVPALAMTMRYLDTEVSDRVARSVLWQHVGDEDFDALLAVAEAAHWGDSAERCALLTTREHVISTTRQADAVSTVGGPVRVVFVGGNEHQTVSSYRVDADIADRFGGRVTVVWVTETWGAHWRAHAEVVDRELDTADVVCLMALVPTNLGITVRRLASEHGRPWVRVTAPGRNVMFNSIVKAVGIVDRLRLESAVTG